MAAIFKLRRASSASPALTDGELFLNYNTGTIQFCSGSTVSNLVPLNKSVTGNIVLDGDITADNITLSGDITIGGNIFLGDSIADNIVVSGEFSSSLIPNDDNTFDLGSSSKKWKNLHSVSASIDNVSLPGSGIVSSSQQISNYNTFLEINGDGVFSGSSQVNADSITNFDTNVKDKMNDDGVISGSSQLTTEFDTRYLNTNGDSVISSSAQLTTEFDTRYLNTEGDSVVSSSQQISDYNTFLEINGDSVVSSSQQISDYNTFLEINGDGVFSGSSQVNANDITNFDSNVKDKMNADGVISGSEQLEGEFLQINGDSVVSSSQQISDYNTFLEINGDGVVSGSGQINTLFVGTAVSTSLDSRLDSLETDSHTHANKANLDTINQDLATTDNVTFNSGSFTSNVTITGDLVVLGSATEIQTSELRIEDKLITVASGSADSAAADGAGLEVDGANKSLQWDHNSTSFVFDAKVSSSVGFKGEGGELTGIDTDQVTEATNLYYTNTRVLDYINGLDIHSGSYLGTATTTNLTEGTNLYYTDARVLSYINDRGLVSGSEQITFSGLSGIPSGLVSGSEQITFLDISSIPSGLVSGSSQIDHNLTTNYTESRHIDHSQITVGSGKGLSGGGTINVSRSITLDTGSTHFTDGVVEALPNNLVSGSSQITDGSGIISSSTFVSNEQGAFTASINGTNTSVDLGLETTDSPTFSNISLTGVTELGVAEVNALVSGSGGSTGYRVLGTAAFLNVSASVGDDANSIPTNQAVNNALIAAGAGDLTEFNPTNTFSPEDTGLIHLSSGTDVGGTRGVQGNIHVAVATGSAHFTSGVVSALPNGLVSQSAQIDVTSTTNYSSINQYSDTKVLNYINDRGVLSGSAQILDGSGIVSSSTQISNYNTFLEINSDNVVSSSLQINSLFAGTAVSTSLDSRIDSLETDSHTHSNKANLDTINQDLSTSDNVTFGDGNFSGNVEIDGNLTVVGSSTELQVSELRVEDKLITLASGSTTSLQADGGGIEIEGANQSFTWDHTNSRFVISTDTRVSGDITATGDVVAYASSDERLKDNIQPIENPLEKINQISGNSFIWNEEKQNIYKGKDYGVIAQEIEKVLPELVTDREDGYKAVKYDKIISLLIEGIKELSEEVTKLKNK